MTSLVSNVESFFTAKTVFLNAGLSNPGDDVEFQLHGFSDASNLAFSSVIYLCRLVNGISVVSLVFVKCNTAWLISLRGPLVRRSLSQL